MTAKKEQEFPHASHLVEQFKKALIQERKWREDAEYGRDKMKRTLDDAQDWFGQKAWKEFEENLQ